MLGIRAPRNDNDGLWVEGGPNNDGTVPPQGRFNIVKPETLPNSQLGRVHIIEGYSDFQYTMRALAIETGDGGESGLGRLIEFDPRDGSNIKVLLEEAPQRFWVANAARSSYYSLIVQLQDGTLRGYGSNSSGQLGLGTSISAGGVYGMPWTTIPVPWTPNSWDTPEVVMKPSATWIVNDSKLYAAGTGELGLKDTKMRSFVLQNLVPSHADVLQVVPDVIRSPDASVSTGTHYLRESDHALYYRVWSDAGVMSEVRVGTKTYPSIPPLPSMMFVSTDGHLMRRTRTGPTVLDDLGAGWAKFTPAMVEYAGGYPYGVGEKTDGSLWFFSMDVPNGERLGTTETCTQLVMSRGNIVIRKPDGTLAYWGNGFGNRVEHSAPAAPFPVALITDQDILDPAPRVFASIAGNTSVMYAIDMDGKVWSTMYVDQYNTLVLGSRLKYNGAETGQNVDFDIIPPDMTQHAVTAVYPLYDDGYEVIAVLDNGTVWGGTLGPDVVKHEDGSNLGMWSISPLLPGTLLGVSYGTVHMSTGIYQLRATPRTDYSTGRFTGSVRTFIPLDGDPSISHTFKQIQAQASFQTVDAFGDATYDQGLVAAVGHDWNGVYKVWVFGQQELLKDGVRLILNIGHTPGEGTPLRDNNNVIPQVRGGAVYLFSENGIAVANLDILMAATGVYPLLSDAAGFPHTPVVDIALGRSDIFAVADTKVSNDQMMFGDLSDRSLLKTEAMFKIQKIWGVRGRTHKLTALYGTPRPHTSIYDVFPRVVKQDGSGVMLGEEFYLNIPQGTQSVYDRLQTFVFEGEVGMCVLDSGQGILTWGMQLLSRGRSPNRSAYSSASGSGGALVPAGYMNRQRGSAMHDIYPSYSASPGRTVGRFNGMLCANMLTYWSELTLPVPHSEVIDFAGYMEAWVRGNSPYVERLMLLTNDSKIHAYPVSGEWVTLPGNELYTRVFLGDAPAGFALRADGSLWSVVLDIAPRMASLVPLTLGRPVEGLFGQVGNELGWTDVRHVGMKNGSTAADGVRGMAGLRAGKLYVWGDMMACGYPGAVAGDVSYTPRIMPGTQVWKTLMPGGVALTVDGDLYVFGSAVQYANRLNGEANSGNTMRQVTGKWIGASVGIGSLFAMRHDGVLLRARDSDVIPVGEPDGTYRAFGAGGSGGESFNNITHEALQGSANWVGVQSPGVFVRSTWRALANK